MKNGKLCIKWWLVLVVLASVYDYVVPSLQNGFSVDSESKKEDQVERRIKRQSNPELTTTIQTRHLYVRDRCEDMGETVMQQPPDFPISPFISHHNRLFFCTAGSSFFTKYFIAIQTDGPMTNPYTVDISKASKEKLLTLDYIQFPHDKAAFLKSYSKAVFTRNPYARLLSAYIDKLYSPNLYYWDTWGKVAIDLNRLNSQDYPCGSGISFPQFINAVIRELSEAHISLMPMDDICKFCEVGYDIVGKTEQSIKDLDFFSQTLNVSPEFLYDENYKVSSVKDAINELTKNALSIWKTDISNCISDYDSGRIIWRNLQMRGIIDAAVDFPFSEKAMGEMTLIEFREACYKAARESTDKSRLFKQKKIAMQQAYRLITNEQISRLQQIYGRDFLLLGYDDSRPDQSISQTIGVKSNGCFDWSRPWIFPYVSPI